MWEYIETDIPLFLFFVIHAKEESLEMKLLFTFLIALHGMQYVGLYSECFTLFYVGLFAYNVSAVHLI